MVTRQIRKNHYNKVVRYLKSKAVQSAFSASYEIVMTINNKKYQLYFQPEKKSKLLLLQAVESTTVGYFKQKLITDNLVLMAFMEVFLFQLNIQNWD